MPDVMIEVTGISKSFGGNLVLKEVSMRVKKGSVVALIGPSGSGKSTLLRCINLLTVPDAGRIKVGDYDTDFDKVKTKSLSDRSLSKFRAKTGMVFQHFNLFPHMTVIENVMEGMVTVLKEPYASARAQALALLERVGLLEKAGEFPSKLSGGQKQRVAIARALAMKPQVMLFDEVTSALDPELVGEVLMVMKKLAKDGMTMIIVTHEISFARDVADEVVFMKDGQILETGGAKQVVDHPQVSATQAFLMRFHEGAER